jgi:hypothetical protein
MLRTIGLGAGVGPASASAPGTMSAADFSKLAGVAASAAALGTATPLAVAGTAAAGDAAAAAHENHVHPETGTRSMTLLVAAADLAASQTNLNLPPSTYVTNWLMPFAGSIQCLTAQGNATPAGGTWLVQAARNGTPIVGCATVATAAALAYAVFAAGLHEFAAGDLISLTWTSSAGYTPTSIDWYFRAICGM